MNGRLESKCFIKWVMKSHKIKSYNELCGNVQDHLEGRETRSRETN